MKILIIGGAGYIGSHQVKMMLDVGYDVVVLDNLSTGHIEMVDSRAKFINGDIRNITLLKETMSKYKIDVIMHFAALSIVKDSMVMPLDYYDNNVYGMQVLLQAMVETDVKKIIFSSTAAVFGNQKDMPIDENYKKNPTNTYGETKLAMEKMVNWASQAYGIKYIVLRYFNVAGAHPNKMLGELHNPETHLIPLALQVVLKKRDRVLIFGDDYPTLDGTCIRDYIHVIDLCDAHKLALEYLVTNEKSNHFNLGYGKGFSVKEIIEEIRNVTGHSLPTTIQERREGDPAELIASSDKAKKELGWIPQYDEINIIIKSAYDFYINY